MKTPLKLLVTGLSLLTLSTLNLQLSTAFAQPGPQPITYQGHLTANGTNYSGDCYFKFSIVNGGANAARGASPHANIVNFSVSSIVIDDPGSG
ncbi:MAG: hypothetical protein NTW03_03485, partial [Verrucomicrobia bacterium]|nr:hypothetical protein [Verrucomicrobiota bacterium]